MWVPEIRFSAPKGASLYGVAQALIAARLGNPAITAKRRWPTDLPTVLKEVEEYNAKVCQTMGWFDYVIPDNVHASPPFAGASDQQSRLARGVQNVVAGAETILDMFGKRGPVDAPLANQRANVCVVCPKNLKSSSWTDFFTAPAAAFIRKTLGILKDMDLRTDADEKLEFCTACSCPLKTKVWAQIEHINAHMPRESRAALHESCWVLSETSKQ